MYDLPTIAQLEKLSLRALAAYAARAARRVWPLLRGVVGDTLVEEILSIAEAVASTENLGRLDSPSAMFAASRLSAASISIEKSASQTLAVMSMIAAARTAFAVLCCVSIPDRAFSHAAHAASAAELAAKEWRALDEPAATQAAQAAIADYETLLKAHARTETNIFGAPIGLDEDSLLGPLYPEPPGA
jgi:hypothetical protein